MALILDGSNGLSDVDGTAATPAIRGADANTGIYFGNDVIGFSEGGTQCGEFDASANFKFNSGYGSVATAYGCRAWVNFNGTGTVSINASGNVSSVTDNGVGDYTVNFTNAMPNTNYAVFGGCREDSASVIYTSNRVVAPRRESAALSTGYTRIGVADFGYTAQDVEKVFVSIFR